MTIAGIAPGFAGAVAVTQFLEGMLAIVTTRAMYLPVASSFSI